MLAIGGAALADIDCNIQYFSFDATHQFALGEGWGLEMQASHHAIAGHGFVVLYKVDFTYLLFEFSLGEAFEEITTGISKNFRFDDDQAFYCAFDDVQTKLKIKD